MTAGIKETPALRSILEFMLRDPAEEMSVRRIAKPLKLSVVTIVRHLNALTEQGFVTRRILNEGGYPAKVYLFKLTEGGVREAEKVMSRTAE